MFRLNTFGGSNNDDRRSRIVVLKSKKHLQQKLVIPYLISRKGGFDIQLLPLGHRNGRLAGAGS